jgi:hypothetical protein
MSFILLGILNSQAAGEFDPASLNPDVWLDASDATTITESGGDVSQWDNKGSKPDFSQGTSADQPTTGVATLNGLNVIDFNDEFLIGGGTTSDWKFLSDGTEYFVCGVFRNQGSLRGTFISTSKAASSVVGMNIRFEDNNTDLDFVITASGGNIPALIDLTPDANYNVYSVITDPDNVTAADRAFMFKNDIQSPSTNSQTSAPSTSNPESVLQIGADGEDLDRLDGQIAELVLVSGTNATETNRQKVVEYLNAKWSVF